MQSPQLTADAFSGVAWGIAQAVAVLLCLLLLQIIALRAVLHRRKGREERFREVWEPLLASCIDVYPSRLPRVRRRDRAEFLLVWNYFQESLRETAKDRLNRIARRLDMDNAAIRLVRRGGVRERLIAMTAIGHLGDTRPWDRLIAVAHGKDPIESLCAARALLRIDAPQAARIIVPLIARRTDWPAAGAAAALFEAGPDAISKPLAEAAVAADRTRAPLLIRLLELAHSDDANEAVETILARTTETEVMTACLRVLRDPGALEMIRGMLGDERWQIRLHAAQALGRMGTQADESRLLNALADRQWWVRYRAAQALGSLPLMTVRRLRDLTDTVEDRYGRDILRQIIAEKELAC